MVDAADSKSVARKGVLVRVRPGAPGFIKGLLVKIPANALANTRLTGQEKGPQPRSYGTRCHTYPRALRPWVLSASRPTLAAVINSALKRHSACKIRGKTH